MKNKSIWIGGIVGGIGGLIFSYPLLFIVPYFIWFIGKIFSSSYLMRIGCIDSCESFTLIIRSAIIVIFSILCGFVIGRKLGFVINKMRRKKMRGQK